MNPPSKNPAKTQQQLAALMREAECSDMTWHEKKISPASDRESCRDYVQTLTPPERYYGANLWPWYLRGPFCAWLRNWYARRHPEIFGEDYQ